MLAYIEYYVPHGGEVLFRRGAEAVACKTTHTVLEEKVHSRRSLRHVRQILRSLQREVGSTSDLVGHGVPCWMKGKSLLDETPSQK
jgi:hypothetical protein